MPDETPVPAPARAPRGPISAAHAAALNTAEVVARAAQRAPHAATLAARGVPAESVAALAADVLRCRDLFQSATAARSSGATTEESAARAALIEGIRQVQAAAAQKYRPLPAGRARLAAYHVGKSVTRSRAQLAQAAEGILSQLASDTLPGVAADDLDRLRALRDAWNGADSRQAGGRAVGQTHRAEAIALLKDVTARRVALQYAAEAAYPHTRSEDAGARAEFVLPIGRPFRG